MDPGGGNGGQHGLDIDAGGAQQRVPQGAAQLIAPGPQVGVLHIQHLAHQGEAVGVQAVGAQGEDHVPAAHLAGGDGLCLVHHAHGEARQVVVLGGHEAGVLGGLAADEGAAGLDAALRHAGDDGGHLLWFVLADGDIVQEEQGHGAAADDIVDAHGYAVDADGVVAVHQLGDADLCAHAVGAGDQAGLGHAGNVQGEQPAEAADGLPHARGHGPGHMPLHQLHGLVAGGDVHAGGGVGGGVTLAHGGSHFLGNHSFSLWTKKKNQKEKLFWRNAVSPGVS